MNFVAPRSLMLASVKLNQMVRPSGHRATSASTTSMGVRKIQAVRVRFCMVRALVKEKAGP